MKIHTNCLEIIQNYQSFLVDVWGVLHSSGVPYANAHNALKQMMNLGKVVLLSNAPRRAKKVQNFLLAMGFFKGEHFHEIITSGEAFIMHAQEKNYHQVFYMGPEKDLDIFHNTNISITTNPDDYYDDAILTGLVSDNNNTEADIKILKTLIPKNITLSCINPDIVVKSGNSNILCAGAVAKEYKKMGGKVKYFGKPHGEVYKIAKQLVFGKILAIGDGIETDILGANSATIDSILCISGIHQAQIEFEGIEEFLSQHIQKPSFVVHQL